MRKLVGVVLLAGCTASGGLKPAAPPTPNEPYGFTVEEEARILQLEDRREYDAALVEVQSVVIGSSGGKHTCTMTLRLSHRNDTTMEWTVNGMTADQVAEKRARLILLGEPLTTGDRHADTLLFGLRGRDAVEKGLLEAVLPKLWHTYKAKPTECLRLARLQAVFALKVTNTVEHILAFTLGPIVKSGVQVHFEGRRSQVYTNRPATVIRVAGKCPLPVRV